MRIRKESVAGSAAILAIAGLSVKFLGFFYRVYLANMIGAEGMGLFQLISPVYSLIILTLTAGISIAVSRLTAQYCAVNNHAKAFEVTRKAAVLVVAAGMSVAVAMLFGSRYIASHILHDTRTYLSLLCLIPCIPIIALASAFKGYFYGIRNVVPTAISQMAEQCVKIIVILILVQRFQSDSLEIVCAVALVAMIAGEIANLLIVMLFYYLKENRVEKKTGWLTQSKYIKHSIHSIRNKLTEKSKLKNILKIRSVINNRIKGVTEEIIKIAVPVSANRFIISIMMTIEHLMIPARLRLTGMPYKECIAEFGKLMGMAFPMIFFPCIVTSSIATALVPAITEDVSSKNFRLANNKISKSIQLTLLMGFSFSAIFMTFPEIIDDILFKENLSHILYLLSFSCVFIYLQQTMQGILHGLGKEKITLRNTIIGDVLRIAIIFYMVPIYGIEAYIWGIVISCAVLCILDIIAISKATGTTINIRQWAFKPLIATAIVFISGNTIKQLGNINVLPGFENLMILGVGALFTGILMFAAGGYKLIKSYRSK